MRNKQPENITAVETCIIREISQNYYMVELPPTTNEILTQILRQKTGGYIWFLEQYHNHWNRNWIAENHPSCFGEVPNERILQIRYMCMDIIFEKDIFLKYINRFDNYIDAVYSQKPKPPKLDLNSIPDHNKGKLFIENQIEFYYSLPHPNEYSNVYSTSIEMLERFINASRRE